MKLSLDFEKNLRNERKLLIDMLTHEIKNPLASISLAVGSLSNMIKDDSAQVMRRIENISQSVRNMDMILERCNLMNQLDQKTMHIDAEPIKLHDMTELILKRFPDARRVFIYFDFSQTFSTDGQLFQIIVSNLIENALKYSPKNSEIGLSLSSLLEDRAVLRISISNLIGPKGYPDKKMAFNRYYRNPLAQDESGSGIGLYLVRQLVNLLGGQIEYKATETKVTFTLQIPEAKIHG